VVRRDRVLPADPSPRAGEAYQRAPGLRCLPDNRQVVAGSEVLILSVKPQNLAAVLSEVRASLTAKHLAVSIVAGATLRQLGEGLGQDQRLIRVMPNTACLLGASASAYAPGPTATTE